MMLRTKLVVGFLGIAVITSMLGIVSIGSIVAADRAFTRYTENVSTADQDMQKKAAQQKIHRSLDSAQNMLMGGSFAILLFASIIGIFFARTISRPINRLHRMIRDISRGNLGTDIDESIKQRNDEIGSLAQAFDRTIISLKIAMKRTAPELAEQVTQTKEKRDEALSLLEATFDAVDEAIAITDMDHTFREYNEAFLDIWGLPDGMSDAEEAVRQAAEKVRNPEEFRNRVEYLFEHPDESAEDTIRLTDGTILKRHARPLKSDGETIGRLWRFRAAESLEEHDNEDDR